MEQWVSWKKIGLAILVAMTITAFQGILAPQAAYVYTYNGVTYDDNDYQKLKTWLARAVYFSFTVGQSFSKYCAEVRIHQ